MTLSLTNYFRFLILMLAVLVIHGCGFQLRGLLDISEAISPLYIEQNNSFELARELKLLLEKNKIVVDTDSERANSQLTLLSEKRNRHVLSVDGQGRAKEYLLTYTVDILIKIKQSKEKRDSVSLSHSLLFDSEAVLATTNESEILYRDMRKNAARLILLKLHAHSSNQSASDDGSTVGGSALGQKENPANNTGGSTGL